MKGARALLALLLASLTLAPILSGQVLAREDLGLKYCGEVVQTSGLLDSASDVDKVVGPKVYSIRIEGVIDYSMAEYIDLAIERAEKDNALLIMELNTPGGLLDAALEIVSSLSKAEIPVVGFVVDKWAESAGTMILVASHVAAMQPGTIIGSLQPIQYDPTSGTYEPINESKIINPIIEILCEHGASKGRNATALVRFVLFNDNYGANDALKYGVIDVIARDSLELVEKLDGKAVKLPSGTTVRLELGREVEPLQPTLRIRILHTLSDPLLSGLLLSLGMLVLLFSLVSGNPGGIGVGALLLLLGLAGSGFNPNITSLLLLLGGSILLFIELYTPGFGIIGGTGIVMLILGIAILPVGGEGFSVSPGYAKQLLQSLYATGAVLGSFTGFVVYKVMKVRKRRPDTWTLMNAQGRATEEIRKGEEGFVFVEGEYWKAKSLDDLKPGDPVVVVGKDGPILLVRKAKRGERL
ncbi:MAG: nodulation protein NfeD [Desulfurococcales archaeon]|nr:nodulation protein NfeD [Desulfurococcales archaeon]